MDKNWEIPEKPARYRVMMCGGILPGWYEASVEERKKNILPRFKEVIRNWQEKFHVRLIGTIDDDLFTAGPSGSAPWNFYLLYEVDHLEKVTAMINSIRRYEEGQPLLDRYFRFEAIIGKPFSWLDEKVN